MAGDRVTLSRHVVKVTTTQEWLDTPLFPETTLPKILLLAHAENADMTLTGY